jgi:cobalamin biosynthesis protein CobT
MKKSSFLGRRRHEDDDERDIFATCADYDNNNIFNGSDRDSSANEDASTDSDLSEDGLSNESNYEENNAGNLSDEEENGYTTKNGSESIKPSHAGETNASKDFSLNNSKKALKLSEGKETDTYTVNNTNAKNVDTTESHTISKVLPNNMQRSYKAHEKRFRRRMRGKGGFESGNGRAWDRDTSKDKKFRYPSYFEHEDRLTEVHEDSSARSNRGHLNKSENVGGRRNQYVF